MGVTVNLRKNQTSPLTTAQMDANFQNLATAVDTNTSAINGKASLSGAAFTGSVTTTGRVGAGVANPAYELDVLDSTLTGTTTGSNRIAQFQSGAAGRDAHIALGDSVGATARIGYLSGALYWWTNGVERMRLDMSGRLGLGLTPAKTLDVLEATAGSSVIAQFLRSTSASAGDGNTIAVGNSNIQFGAEYAATGWAMKFLTAGTERARIDANGNFGLGVTPSAWSGYGSPVLEIANTVVAASPIQNTGANWYYNGANFIYKTNGAASYSQQNQGVFKWFQAPTGTAGATATFTQAMMLDSSGRLGIGATPQAWNSGSSVVQLGSNTTFESYNGAANLIQGGYRNSSGGWTYVGTSGLSAFSLLNGAAQFYAAPPGTSGAAATLTQTMALDNSGNLQLGSGTARAQLDVRNPGTAADLAYFSTSGANGGYLVLIDGNTTAAANAARIGGAGNNLRLAAGGADRVIVDNTGNLLVGVTSGTKHTIFKTGTNAGDAILSISGGGNVPGVDIFFGNNTGAANAANAVMKVGLMNVTGRSINAAGTINASGADYAEYYQKAADAGIIAKGQIVGIDANGHVTDKWANAASGFLIKTTDPNLVGGDAWFAKQPPEQPLISLPQYAGSAHPGNAPVEPSAPTAAQPVEPTAPASDADDEAVAAYKDACARYRDDLADYSASQVAYQAALSAYHVERAAYDTALTGYEADQKAHADAVQAAQNEFDSVIMPEYQADRAAFNERLEAARANVDRLSFCGQVPVNVKGAKPGQYVVPVQDGDGIGGKLYDADEVDAQPKLYRLAVGVVQNILFDGRANVRVKPV